MLLFLIYGYAYNLIKDPCFEDTSSQYWVETESHPDRPEWSDADAHDTAVVYEGNFSGRTYCNWQLDFDDTKYAMLSQVLSEREVSSLSDFLWYIYVKTTNYWRRVGFIKIHFISKQGDTLCYLYEGNWVVLEPEETPNYKIIKLVDKTDTFFVRSWVQQERDFYSDWVDTCGFSFSDTIVEIQLISMSAYNGGWGSLDQDVHWDSLVFVSNIADYDIGIVKMLSPSWVKPEAQYVPSLRIENSGVKDVGDFKVVCVIMDGEEEIYGDTVVVDGLLAGEERDVEFRTWSSSGEEKDYTINFFTEYEKDEVGENDTLSSLLSVGGVKEKCHKENVVKVNYMRGEDVLYMEGLDGKGVISIYSKAGRLSIREEVSESKNKVYLKGAFPVGEYFYILRTDGGLKRGKFYIY